MIARSLALALCLSLASYAAACVGGVKGNVGPAGGDGGGDGVVGPGGAEDGGGPGDGAGDPDDPAGDGGDIGAPGGEGEGEAGPGGGDGVGGEGEGEGEEVGGGGDEGDDGGDAGGDDGGEFVQPEVLTSDEGGDFSNPCREMAECKSGICAQMGSFKMCSKFCERDLDCPGVTPAGRWTCNVTPMIDTRDARICVFARTE